MPLTQKRVQELLDRWQRILRLSHWDIEIKARPRKKMEDKADGLNHCYPNLQEAEIEVVKGNTSSKFADHETIVVHELVHCHTSLIDEKFPESEEEVEKVVEVVAKSFVSLDREWRNRYEKLLAKLRELGIDTAEEEEGSFSAKGDRRGHGRGSKAVEAKVRSQRTGRRRGTGR